MSKPALRVALLHSVVRREEKLLASALERTLDVECVMLDGNRPDEAVTVLERAATLRRGAADLDPRLLATTSFALAEAYWVQGDQRHAVDLARQARGGFDGPWEFAFQDVAMIERWLSAHRA